MTIEQIDTLHRQQKEIKMEQIDITKNSLQHRILSCLATNGTLATSQVKSWTGSSESVVKIENILHNQLLRSGLVMRQEMTWTLTNAGLDLKIQLGGIDDSRPFNRGKTIAARNDLFARGVYDGAELKPNCVRQGAYAAFNMPSLSFAGRTYRKDTLV